MNKTFRFKDEIRKSFISYALIPCIIFVVLIVVGSFVIWSMGIYRTLKNENMILHALFENTITQYTVRIEEATYEELSIFDMKTNANTAATILSPLSRPNFQKNHDTIFTLCAIPLPKAAPYTSLGY